MSGVLCIFNEFVILKNDWVKVFGVNVISLLILVMLKCFICFCEMVEVECGVLRIDLLKLNIDFMFWLGRLFSEFLILIFLIFVLEMVFFVFCVIVSDDVDNVKFMVKVCVSGFNLNVVLIMFFLLFLLILE